jgi:hypothetical protein
MARGGKRPNAGRRVGTKTRKVAERIAVAERALAEGLTPLDYMLSILRDTNKEQAERFAAAKEAAPYLHPRLSSIEANVKATMSHEETLRRLEDEAGAGVRPN